VDMEFFVSRNSRDKVYNRGLLFVVTVLRVGATRQNKDLQHFILATNLLD
jgi:hypothetical protein